MKSLSVFTIVLTVIYLLTCSSTTLKGKKTEMDSNIRLVEASKMEVKVTVDKVDSSKKSSKVGFISPKYVSNISNDNTNANVKSENRFKEKDYGLKGTTYSAKLMETPTYTKKASNEVTRVTQTYHPNVFKSQENSKYEEPEIRKTMTVPEINRKEIKQDGNNYSDGLSNSFASFQPDEMEFTPSPFSDKKEPYYPLPEVDRILERMKEEKRERKERKERKERRNRHKHSKHGRRKRRHHHRDELAGSYEKYDQQRNQEVMNKLQENIESFDLGSDRNAEVKKFIERHHQATASQQKDSYSGKYYMEDGKIQENPVQTQQRVQTRQTPNNSSENSNRKYPKNNNHYTFVDDDKPKKPADNSYITMTSTASFGSNNSGQRSDSVSYAQTSSSKPRPFMLQVSESTSDDRFTPQKSNQAVTHTPKEFSFAIPDGYVKPKYIGKSSPPPSYHLV